MWKRKRRRKTRQARSQPAREDPICSGPGGGITGGFPTLTDVLFSRRGDRQADHDREAG
jgi:hypothetical protein